MADVASGITGGELGKTKVIFLCTGNSARSQMAEAMLRRYAGSHFEVFSAGFDVKGIHPLTRQVMAEAGYGLEGHESKPLSRFLGKVHFGIIITVCKKAEETCPTMPGVGTRLFWPVDDPAQVSGTEVERKEAFRQARDELKEMILDFLKDRRIPVTEE
ncbi:MAG: arsenate reductase ArsC [Candidatus Lokiarchaeota archaeon]|nr:arsenate reductase ArsC [Candidatus Lokiarchaeota archaeon]